MMNKMGLFGGVFLPLLFILMFVAPAWGYITYLHIDNGLLISGLNIYVFSGTKPNQVSVQTLVEGINYTIENDVPFSGHTTRRYSLLNIPYGTAYLLFKTSTNYGVVGPYLAGSTAPTYHYVSAVTYYKLGQPTPPTIGTIATGYETANAPLGYSSDYEYNGIDVAVWNYETSSFIGATTSKGGQPASYQIGELIDGRKLETDISGKIYQFQVRGKVDGVAPSDWVQQDFTTKPLTAGGGPITSEVTLKNGLNFFSLGVPSIEASKDWAYSTDGGATWSGTKIKSISELIGIIGGTDKVSTFGYVKNGTSGDVEGIRAEGTSFVATPAGFTGRDLNATQGYQIFCKNLPVEGLNLRFRNK